MRIATDHTLIEPDLHDGRVVGVTVLDNKCITIELKEERGKRHTLELVGVAYLQIDDFLVENIIRDIYIVPPESVRIEDACEMFRIDLNNANSKRELDAKMSLIARSNLSMVIIAPSLGCITYALCKSVGIRAQE
jgi:hypothetical protein